MKLILTTDVEHLGTAGDVVEVKNGYGRNYLVPKGFAIPATRGALKQAEAMQRSGQARRVRDLEHARELKVAIESGGHVALSLKTHDSGKLFGSVTPAVVAEAIKGAGGPTVDKHSIELPKEHIKSTGQYPVSVHLGEGIVATFSLRVIPET